MINNCIIITILSLILLILYLGNKSKYSDIFSPLNILTISWTVPFVISLLNLSEFQLPMSIKSWNLILASTFILYSLQIIKLKPNKYYYQYHNTKNYSIGYCNITSLLILNLAACLAAIYFKILAEFQNGIPLLSYLNGSDLDCNLHMIGKNSKFQILADLLPTCGALAFFCLINSQTGTLQWFLSFIILSIPIISGILAANKFDVVKTIFLYIPIYYYYNQSFINKNKLKIFFVILAITMPLFFISRIRMDGAGYHSSYAEAIHFKKIVPSFMNGANSILAYPYGYICLNFENCSRYIDFGRVSNAIGTSFFHPLMTVSFNGDYVKNALENIDLLEVSGAANMGTYIRDLFVEGGCTMVLIASFVYSFFIRIVYSFKEKRKDILSIFVYSSFLMPLMWLNYCNAFAVLTTFTNPLIGSTIIILSSKIKFNPDFALGAAKLCKRRGEGVSF